MVEVRRLRREDDRSAFRSGNSDLDRFFLRYAGQNQFRHAIGTTWVAVGNGPILGYVTVSPTQVAVDDLPAARRGRLPRYPVPALRLARLAVAEAARGRRIGSLLVQAVLDLALLMRSQVGCWAVVVDAKPSAVGFYDSLGFERLVFMEGSSGTRPAPIPMFLPLTDVLEAGKQVAGD
jgi:GNAT superfamily N-acetyltransferase